MLPPQESGEKMRYTLASKHMESANGMTASSAGLYTTLVAWAMAFTAPRCSTPTSFGGPVEPDVYMA